MAEAPHDGRSRLADLSDQFLADRAADGDHRAFAELVHRHGRALRGYALRIVGSADSDDVVQDALIVAWDRLDGLEDRTAIRSWLITITTRKALDTVRARRPLEDIDDHEPAAPPAAEPHEVTATGSMTQALDDALAALPEQQRQVWVMRELGGLSYQEIADALELPLSTIRGLIARTRRTLVTGMKEWR